MNATVDTIISTLASAPSLPDVFNPWKDLDPLDCSPVNASRRRDNLRAHFDCNPRFILIGEAPGYQGCHFSGIPFTSERLITLADIPRVTDFHRITTRELSFSEPSATIVWRALHENGIADETVLWNSFAFHPHRPGKLMSNRRPTQKELMAGLPILKAVLDHFSQAKVVAVGACSEFTLKRLGVTPFALIRHPAYGGAAECREGIRKLASAELVGKSARGMAKASESLF